MLIVKFNVVGCPQLLQTVVPSLAFFFFLNKRKLINLLTNQNQEFDGTVVKNHAININFTV